MLPQYQPEPGICQSMIQSCMIQGWVVLLVTIRYGDLVFIPSNRSKIAQTGVERIKEVLAMVETTP